MSKWNIEFVMEKIKSDERINYKREVVKDETVANLEVEDTDLNIMLNCNDANSKFSYKELFENDKKNILKDEIREDMIKEYYVRSYKLNFSNKTGEIKLSYPKINLL